MTSLTTQEQSQQSKREEKEKSRAQSAWEFFEVLQREYLVCELRATIYPLEKDKRYWTKVANQKRITIEEVSAANLDWPTIFNDPSKYKEYRGKLLNATGLPNFIYKGRDDSNTQGLQDQIYWFNVGCNVNIFYNDEMQAAKIIEYIPYKTCNVKITLAKTGETISVNEDQIIRILH